jgi:hypothetical protein
MTSVYFITGLPRSRTAWISNLLTSGCSFCWHDAAKFGGVAGICSALDAALLMPGVKVAGNSDSGLAMFSRRLMEIYPLAKWVIVWRDFESALEDFIKAFTADPYTGIPAPEPATARQVFQNILSKLDELKAKISQDRLLELNVDQLDNMADVRRLWDFCVPHEPLNVDRWLQLDGFNISVIGHKIRVDRKARLAA